MATVRRPSVRRGVFVGVVLVVLLAACVVGANLAVGSGSGGSSGSGLGQLPTGSATTDWLTNANGLSYGSSALATSYADEPDLILAVATNGKTGYCLRTDLEKPAKTLEEAALQVAQGGKSRVIPVYEVDGITQIGVFVVGPGGAAHVGTWSPN
jgi:hypothetical protein